MKTENPPTIQEPLNRVFGYTKAFPGAEETEASSSLDKPGEPPDTSRERKGEKRAGRFEKEKEGREREESKGEGEN